jgi:phosphoribosylglycinamide formyltransferase-1
VADSVAGAEEDTRAQRTAMKSLVILISGRGSNMAALLEARVGGRIAAVISNVPGAAGLGIAEAAGIPTAVVDHRAYAGRPEFETALAAEIGRHDPDLVVLAGFMRVLSASFVSHFEGRLLNIHPSLLPAFPGLHTHRGALQAGARIHGCTVHFVGNTVDEGPIVIQAAVPVLPSDTEETLAARVLEQEHRIYPAAVRWFCEGRLRLSQGRVELEGASPGALVLVSPAPDTP